MIDGLYAALSRQDNENNYLMLSDDVRIWGEAERIQVPTQPWELMQLGNCGSPLETEAGWLVMTHGVGPMRCYSLGAILLDADDPKRVIGHLDDPLLVPSEEERDGYVPNVVYSCGSMIHGDEPHPALRVLRLRGPGRGDPARRPAHQLLTDSGSPAPVDRRPDTRRPSGRRRSGSTEARTAVAIDGRRRLHRRYRFVDDPRP